MPHIGLRILFAVLLSSLLSGCSQESQSEQAYFITWDQSSLVCIADEGAYPRLRRLQDNTLLAVFENRKGDVVLKASKDTGTTWGEPIAVYERFTYTDEELRNTTKVNIANPEIIQLNNGDLLLACNLRPQKEGIYPFSIALKRSSNQGATWSDAQILYEAAPYFKDGCWEPAFLILPDGTVRIYFANESPYRDSDEQEISMLSSNDNGITWSKEPITVSFRQGFRDGMPVAVHNGEQIFVSIEDNVSGQFKPYILSTSIEHAWLKPVFGNSTYRHNALKTPLPDAVYAGAPYLIRTDKGIYLLSYQTTENRSSNWEHSTMEVVISDSSSGFTNSTQPFEVPLSKEAKWNSLTDLGNDTVAALSSTNFNSDKIGVWMIKGKIIKK